MAYNAYFKSDNAIERQISNLAYSEFTFQGRVCHSLEGFYQGIKRNGDDIQNYIFQSSGLYAKNYSKPTTFVYFNGEKYKAGSKEHHNLILEAQKCKFSQCEKSRKSLLATRNSKITHKTGRDSPLYPAKVYCKHLTIVRTLLQKGEL